MESPLSPTLLSMKFYPGTIRRLCFPSHCFLFPHQKTVAWRRPCHTAMNTNMKLFLPGFRMKMWSIQRPGKKSKQSHCFKFFKKGIPLLCLISTSYSQGWIPLKPSVLQAEEALHSHCQWRRRICRLDLPTHDFLLLCFLCSFSLFFPIEESPRL